jgi:hypothetical protein
MGMGIQFMDLGANDRGAIEAYLAHLVAAQICGDCEAS